MNNLPIEKKENFFTKIIKFFKSIFGTKKDKIEKEVYETKVENESINGIRQQDINIKEKFTNSIKTEVKNDFFLDNEKEKFLDDIQKNPELLYSFPINKLEKIEEAFKESVKNKEEKLNKLRKAS